MRVGIVGCGIAGMAAAVFLKRRGINPEIYESMDSISDFSPRGELLLPVYTKPISNIPRHIKDTYKLSLKPHARVRRIIWHTLNATATAMGNLGHITLRGRHEQSMDQQLARMLDCKVHFGQTRNLPFHRSEYDWLINATGHSDKNVPGRRLICFRGGSIQGKFDPETVHMWHTSKATPGGFAYLVPLSANQATVFIVIPLSARLPSDLYWRRFWGLLVRDLGFEPELLRPEEFRKYHAESLPSPGVNVLNVGSSLGTAIPFLGVDQFIAVSTAFFAAGTVGGLPGYQREINAVGAHLQRMKVIRKAMDTWGDLAYDSLVRSMKLGATPFFASRRNLLATVSFTLRPYTWLYSS